MKIKLLTAVVLVLGFAGLLWISPSANSQTSAKSMGLSFTVADTSFNWEKMDHAARLSYMKQVVMPAMKAEFIKFNSEEFELMNCKTCHGEGAENHTFKMPNPKIWKLPRSKEGWAKADTSYLRFMKETVKPRMASLLGMKPFDMKTMTGFGCGNCHTDQE